MATVYVHRKKDNNEIFYVGLSNDENNKRANSLRNRNKIWNDIYKNHGRIVEVIKQGISRVDGLVLERELILKFGRIDLGTGTLANMRDGDKCKANISKELKSKLSKAHTGKILSDATRKKMSESRKGNKYALGCKRTKEFCEKQSELKKGKKFSKERIERYINNHHRIKAIKHIETGIIYRSVKDFCEATNITRSVLSRKIKKDTNFIEFLPTPPKK